MMIFGMAIVLWIACSHVRPGGETSSEGGLA
jgi:hypothetical protein